MRRYRFIHQLALSCMLMLCATQSWGHAKTDLITVANGDQITGAVIGSSRFSSLLHRPGEGMQAGDRLRPVHARVGNALAENQIVFVDDVLPTCLDKALQH